MMQRSVEELVWKDLVLSFFRFSLYTFLKKEITAHPLYSPEEYDICCLIPQGIFHGGFFA